MEKGREGLAETIMIMLTAFSIEFSLSSRSLFTSTSNPHFLRGSAQDRSKGKPDYFDESARKRIKGIKGEFINIQYLALKRDEAVSLRFFTFARNASSTRIFKATERIRDCRLI